MILFLLGSAEIKIQILCVFIRILSMRFINKEIIQVILKHINLKKTNLMKYIDGKGIQNIITVNQM